LLSPFIFDGFHPYIAQKLILFALCFAGKLSGNLSRPGFPKFFEKQAGYLEIFIYRDIY